jgi:hypothetical protein
VTGTWRELEHAWHDTNVVHCVVCGKLIPRRGWWFDGGDGDLFSCGPECESLYETYLRPTYGVLAGIQRA